jgi:hypothetical protein
MENESLNCNRGGTRKRLTQIKDQITGRRKNN